jgi:CheY-like chemotaxis protein
MPSTRPTAPARRATVLAVDDMPANLVALQAVLGRDYNLIEASSGAEAVALMQSRIDIDVILMDVQMPGMDGFEAAARIKAIEGARDVPIIFITAIFKEDPFVKKGYEAGAIDYFCKPFDPDILRMKVGVYSSFRQRDALLRERELHLAQSEELLQAGRRLSSVLERLPVGVLIADKAGRIVQTNDAVARICHATEPLQHDAYGELLGWWDDAGAVIKDPNGPLSRALHEGVSSQGTMLDIKCFDGSDKTVLGSASPLLGVDGAIVGAVIVLHDLTEPKRFEADLEERIAKLISLSVGLEHAA